MPPYSQITQRDLAKLLNLSQSTVSLALAGSTRIPEDTRLQVMAMARKHNYQVDPVLAALATYRSKKQLPAFKGILAWISNHPTAEGWRMSFFNDYYEGAVSAAEAAGYKVNSYWMREPGLSHKRLLNILLAQGVNGIFLAPQEQAGTRLKVDFSEFPVITFGYSLVDPKFHVVTSSGFGLMRRLYESMWELNHRRIALVYEQEVDDRMSNILRGAFFHFQSTHGINPTDSLFTLHSLKTQEKELLQWLERLKPDAIISTNSALYGWLLERGYKIPADLSYAQNLITEEDTVGGCQVDHRRIGIIGAQRLISMIQHREKGPTAVPESTIVDGIFQMGTTVAKRSTP